MTKNIGGWRCIILVSLLMLAFNAFAVPAKPGITRLLTLSDGTTVKAMLVGDEYAHYWVGADGKAYLDKGNNVYIPFDPQTAKEKGNQRRAAANQRRMQRMAPHKTGSAGSITGDKKGIIILVNFKDVSFEATQSDFHNLANTANYNEGNFKGSMYDYFLDQSDGLFRLTFDVVGPYTLSKDYSYYGENDNKGNDMHAAEMVIEALNLADPDVNYADYDWDGNLEVEQVYVVYAGKGEADGGNANTIWPHEYDLYSANYYGDGSGPQTLDGVRINTYACGGEKNGGTGETAGIGTMCHEFSHCLGYPDFYDTDYSGGQGMGYWDLMDSGSYNGNGYLPAGYTSYERWIAGWKTPIELDNTQSINNMSALQEYGSKTYVIYNKGNRNEYYLLENRQKTKWDASLPGAGLLILHVDYDETIWKNNKPNDVPNHQRMTWIAADNQYQYTMYQGKKYYTPNGMANDPFPYGTVNAFGRNTTPAATLYNQNTDGTYFLDSSIENITQNSDGTISFDIVSNNVTAEEIIDFTAQGFENAQEVKSVSGNDCTVTFDKGTNSNTPKYYNTGTAVRIYGGGTMTIASDTRIIASISITFGSSDGTNDITTDVGNYTNGNWTGSASSVTFTIGGTTGHRRIKSVTVGYAGFSDVKPSLTVGKELFYEGLSTYNGGEYSYTIPTDYEKLDSKDWAFFYNIYRSGPGYTEGGCLKLGKSTAYGKVITKELPLQGNGTLTFYLKQYGDDQCKLNIGVDGATINETSFTPTSDWTLCTVNLTNANGNVTITMATSQKRALVDEITLTSNSTLNLVDNNSQNDNSAIISTAAGGTFDVTLTGRTLYKDGEWNTICLPFDLELQGSVLEGATAKTLTDATISGTTVSLTFGNPDSETSPVTTLQAGVPYIIKWEKSTDYDQADPNKRDIINPLFINVKVTGTSITEINKADGHVKFIGYYDAFNIDESDTDIYYMTAGNKLRHTGKARTLKACRAFFRFSEAAQQARTFVLDFGEERTDESLGVRNISYSAAESTFNLQGVKTKQPTLKGIYIRNGKKIIVK